MNEKTMILWLLSALWEKYPHIKEIPLVGFLCGIQDAEPSDANIFKALKAYAEELEKANPDS